MLLQFQIFRCRLVSIHFLKKKLQFFLVVDPRFKLALFDDDNCHQEAINATCYREGSGGHCARTVIINNNNTETILMPTMPSANCLTNSTALSAL